MLTQDSIERQHRALLVQFVQPPHAIHEDADRGGATAHIEAHGETPIDVISYLCALCDLVGKGRLEEKAIKSLRLPFRQGLTVVSPEGLGLVRKRGSGEVVFFVKGGVSQNPIQLSEDQMFTFVFESLPARSILYRSLSFRGLGLTRGPRPRLLTRTQEGAPDSLGRRARLSAGFLRQLAAEAGPIQYVLRREEGAPVVRDGRRIQGGCEALLMARSHLTGEGRLEEHSVEPYHFPVRQVGRPSTQQLSGFLRDGDVGKVFLLIEVAASQRVIQRADGGLSPAMACARHQVDEGHRCRQHKDCDGPFAAPSSGPERPAAERDEQQQGQEPSSVRFPFASADRLARLFGEEFPEPPGGTGNRSRPFPLKSGAESRPVRDIGLPEKRIASTLSLPDPLSPSLEDRTVELLPDLPL